MQQRNTGRFGVKTSQTLKYNSNLGDAKSVTPVYFRWVDVDKDDEESSSRKYDHAIPQSINKQRRWETFDEEIKMEEKQEDQRSNTKEKEERMEKNQELKKQENKKKNQKSKHVKRLEQKEMAKLKKKLGIDDEMEEEKAQALIKEALEKQATSATQNDNGEEQDEEEQKEKIVINREPPKYLSWKSLAPEKNVVSAYIPKDRDQLYKINQLRGRNKDYDQSNVKSRTEKKSDFQKSIFL